MKKEVLSNLYPIAGLIVFGMMLPPLVESGVSGWNLILALVVVDALWPLFLGVIIYGLLH